MRMSRAAALAAALALAITGCADEGGGSTDSAPPESSPTASPTVEKSYVESETCRTEMAPLVDVMDANRSDTLNSGDFGDRLDRLRAELDSALTSCSQAVAEPARDALAELEATDDAWRQCRTAGPKCTKRISEPLRLALNAVDTLKLSLSRRE